MQRSSDLKKHECNNDSSSANYQRRTWKEILFAITKRSRCELKIIYIVLLSTYWYVFILPGKYKRFLLNRNALLFLFY